MIPLYREMIERGVKMDLDTMYVILSRGARYDKMSPQDLFILFDEMKELGAKADITVLELLHTVLESSEGQPAEWREARRLQLVWLYCDLAATELPEYGEKNYQNLLRSQFHRFRVNCRSLKERLPANIWIYYLTSLTDFDTMAEEVAQYLWDFAPNENYESKMIGRLQVAVPVLTKLLNRPDPDSSKASSAKVDTETTSLSTTAADLMQSTSVPPSYKLDEEINSVLLAALGRMIDYPMTSRRTPGGLDPGIAYMFFRPLTVQCGVLRGADLTAQLLDLVKYMDNSATAEALTEAEMITKKDTNSIQILNDTMKGSRVVPSQQQAHWREYARPVDARVVGRLLACRDPWGPNTFTVSAQGQPSSFSVGDSKVQTTSDASAAEGGEKKTASYVIRTAEDVDRRWKDMEAFVKSTNVLKDRFATDSDGLPITTEVYTGMAIWLKRMYDAESRNYDVCAAVFNKLQILKLELDRFCSSDYHREEDASAAGDTASAQVQLVPEVECWEAMLSLIKSMMDFVATRHRSQTTTGVTEANQLFGQLAEFRSQLLKESRQRYGGRFSMLWLEEI